MSRQSLEMIWGDLKVEKTKYVTLKLSNRVDVGGENVALSGLPATDEKECASHVWVFNAVDIFRPLYLYLNTCTGYIFIHFNALLWINYLNKTWFEELIFEPSCFVNHVL